MKILLNRNLWFCLLLISPYVLFAQHTNEVQELVFTKGGGTIDSWFITAMTEINTLLKENANSVALTGRAIGEFGAILYLGHMGWQMLNGERGWDVTPMLKPLWIALILANWGVFTDMVRKPFDYVTSKTITPVFEQLERETTARAATLNAKQKKFIDYLIDFEAEEKAKEKEAEEKTMIARSAGKVAEIIGVDADLSALYKAPIKIMLGLKYNLQFLLARILETICLIILKVCVYFIFLIQQFWIYILVTVGPIAVGFSLIPGFENSFSAWLAKFVNICLYQFIAMSIVSVGLVLIQAAYDMEIERFNAIINHGGENRINIATAGEFVSNAGMITVMIPTLVSYVITGSAMLMVPKIADSIVSAGGSGMMSAMKRSAVQGGGAIKKGAAGGVGAAKGAAEGAARGAAAGPKGMIIGAAVGAVKGGAKGLK